MPVFLLNFKVTAEKNTSIIFWQNIEFYKIHTVIVLLSSYQLNYELHTCYLYSMKNSSAGTFIRNCTLTL